MPTRMLTPTSSTASLLSYCVFLSPSMFNTPPIFASLALPHHHPQPLARATPATIVHLPAPTPGHANLTSRAPPVGLGMAAVMAIPPLVSTAGGDPRHRSVAGTAFWGRILPLAAFPVGPRCTSGFPPARLARLLRSKFQMVTRPRLFKLGC